MHFPPFRPTGFGVTTTIFTCRINRSPPTMPRHGTQKGRALYGEPAGLSPRFRGLGGRIQARAADRGHRIRRRFERWERLLLLGTGIPALVGGLLLFGWVQTQAMFRASEIQTGLAQRNDGGILTAALIASLGLAAILAAMSQRRPRHRIVPALGVVTTSTILLAFHFSFFVNGLIVEESEQLMVEASFIFQDTAGNPIGVFALTFATLLVIGIGLISTMALLTPRILQERVLNPSTLQEHRTRTVLATLLLILGGFTFAVQFFRWALDADAIPKGGFIETNVIALYYILAFMVAGAMVLAAWRASFLSWGDLRERAGRRFRRNHRNLLHLENWVWGTIMLLTVVVMNSAPIFTMESVALNQVFAADSHGINMFFLLVPLLYVMQRVVSRKQFNHLQQERQNLQVIRPDGLLAMAATLILVWVSVPLFIRGPEVTPLIQVFVRTGLATIILLVFALRVDASTQSVLAPRHNGVPLMLLASCGLAILTGIALWGAGNTVVTVYARDSGGFLTPESRFLQPYTVLLRIAGSAFLALPPILTLWMLSAKMRKHAQPGHLVIIAIGTIIAVNLLFTIQATDPLDPTIGRSDVLIGLYLLQLTSAIDTIVMTGIWATATLMTLYAIIRIVLTLNETRILPSSHHRVRASTRQT